MDVSIDRTGPGVVVSPVGDVDLSNSRGLQASLRGVLGEKPGRLLVDLTQVPYMDSSGVATLVEAMQVSRSQDTKLVLCGMQEKVRSIFEIARLDRVFTIVDDREAGMSI